MGTGRTDEFRKDAVRIALTSGLSRRQLADDLGVGLDLHRFRSGQVLMLGGLAFEGHGTFPTQF
jgi:transposase-like protein